MPSYTRHDFDDMSFKIAEQFSDSGTDLNSAVLKMAADKSMNPEQVKRLTEAVNTTVFLKLFKDKPAQDKMVEFDVADPQEVLDKLLGSDSEHKGTLGGGLSIIIKSDVDNSDKDPDTSSFFDDIMDEVKSAAFSGRDKTASYASDYVDRDIHRVTFEKTAKRLDIKSNVHTVHQALETLLTKQASINITSSELASDIAASYRGIYTRDKYAEFEADTLASFGNRAIPGLQMVRDRLGMAKIAKALTPREESFLSDRIVVDNSPALTKMARLVSLTEDCLKINKAILQLGAK